MHATLALLLALPRLEPSSLDTLEALESLERAIDDAQALVVARHDKPKLATLKAALDADADAVGRLPPEHGGAAGGTGLVAHAGQPADVPAPESDLERRQTTLANQLADCKRKYPPVDPVCFNQVATGLATDGLIAGSLAAMSDAMVEQVFEACAEGAGGVQQPETTILESEASIPLAAGSLLDVKPAVTLTDKRLIVLTATGENPPYLKREFRLPLTDAHRVETTPRADSDFFGLSSGIGEMESIAITGPDEVAVTITLQDLTGELSGEHTDEERAAKERDAKQQLFFISGRLSPDREPLTPPPGIKKYVKALGGATTTALAAAYSKIKINDHASGDWVGPTGDSLSGEDEMLAISQKFMVSAGGDTWKDAGSLTNPSDATVWITRALSCAFGIASVVHTGGLGLAAGCGPLLFQIASLVMDTKMMKGLNLINAHIGSSHYSNLPAARRPDRPLPRARRAAAL